MTASLQNGAWSVSPTLTGAGPWQVEVSATDPAGNIGTASQTLTIATAPGLPVVGIDGGATVATNDRTPTISGVTDAAAGTPVTVTVDAQTLLALVQPGGAWNVTLATLADGTFAVAVSVAVGGNDGAATQQLTVDTTAPAATITGGGDRVEQRFDAVDRRHRSGGGGGHHRIGPADAAATRRRSADDRYDAPARHCRWAAGTTRRHTLADGGAAPTIVVTTMTTHVGPATRRHAVTHVVVARHRIRGVGTADRTSPARR